VAILDKPLNT